MWVAFLLGGLVDFAIRDDISKLWEDPVANSIPILFGLSVAALAIGEWGAEEAAESQKKGG